MTQKTLIWSWEVLWRFALIHYQVNGTGETGTSTAYNTANLKNGGERSLSILDGFNIIARNVTRVQLKGFIQAKVIVILVNQQMI